MAEHESDDELHARLAVETYEAVAAAQAALERTAGSALSHLLSWPPRQDAAAREVLAGSPDTQGRYSAMFGEVRVYSPEREELHLEIIRGALSDARATDEPDVIVLAGGPASGKSTHLETHDLARGRVVVDPDAVKNGLPEYAELVAQGSRYAAFGTHEESSDVAKRMIGAAMEQRLPLLLDVTGDGGPGAFGEKLRPFLDAGYEVEVRYVDVSIPVALEWAGTRYEKTGRFLAPSFVREMHTAVAARFDEVLDLRPPVAIKLFDPRGDLLVAKRSRDGRLSVEDEVRWREFRMKASL